MFKRLVLPTDGSELSERAVVAGVNLAKELGASVVGVAAMPEFHVLTVNAEMLEDTEEQFLADTELRADRHLLYVTEAAGLAGIGCACEKVRTDRPYEAILDIGRKYQCDLVVMASHGRSGMKAILLGSETQKVLVHTDIPVLVYR